VQLVTNGFACYINIKLGTTDEASCEMEAALLSCAHCAARHNNCGPARRGEDIMPKMVEYLKADKGTDEETKAKGELQGALKQFDEALTKKVIFL